jgi:hypothetical protein
MGLHDGFADCEMNMVVFPQSQPNGKSRINTHWPTATNEEVSSGPVSGDGGCFFFGKISRALGWAESRGRRVGESVVVIILWRLSQVWVHLRVWNWSSELAHGLAGHHCYDDKIKYSLVEDDSDTGRNKL